MVDEYEVRISNSRGEVTHEPMFLHAGENRIPVGKHVLKIGIMPTFGTVTIDSDPRLLLTSLTDPDNAASLHPDDQSPMLNLKPGEVVQITFNPQTPRGLPRQVIVQRSV